MNEAKLVSIITKKARRRGAVVTVFAQPARVRRQLKGWVDMHIVYHDHVALVEAKGESGEPEDSQIEFYQTVAPHLGDHVVHIWARYLEDVTRWLDRVERSRT